VRRHSAIALRLGGAFVFFGLTPSSFVAKHRWHGSSHCPRGQRGSRCQRAPHRAEYPHLPYVTQVKKVQEFAVTSWANA
jgi:hypothetical protein